MRLRTSDCEITWSLTVATTPSIVGRERRQQLGWRLGLLGKTASPEEAPGGQRNRDKSFHPGHPAGPDLAAGKGKNMAAGGGPTGRYTG